MSFWHKGLLWFLPSEPLSFQPDPQWASDPLRSSDHLISGLPLFLIALCHGIHYITLFVHFSLLLIIWPVNLYFAVLIFFSTTSHYVIFLRSSAHFCLSWCIPNMLLSIALWQHFEFVFLWLSILGIHMLV
jgi:hypothetical protein